MFKQKFWVILVSIPIIIIGILYLKYSSFDVYKYTTDSYHLVSGDRKYTLLVGDALSEYYESTGEKKFVPSKMIGKTSNSRFFGFKETVWKLEGRSVEDIIFVDGLMLEGLYVHNE